MFYFTLNIYESNLQGTDIKLVYSKGNVVTSVLFILSTEAFAKADFKKLEELVKRVLTLKVNMQYVSINYARLNYLQRNFTYGILTCWFD